MVWIKGWLIVLWVDFNCLHGVFMNNVVRKGRQPAKSSIYVPSTRRRDNVNKEEFRKVRKDIERMHARASKDDRREPAQLSGCAGLNRFAHLLQDSEMVDLNLRLDSSPGEVKNFQAFLRGEQCELGQVDCFCKKWIAGNGRIHEKPSWMKEVDRFVENLSMVHTRMEIYRSDCELSQLEDQFNIVKQAGRSIINPSNRQGDGANGATGTIQREFTDEFMEENSRLRDVAGRTNLVGNAEVGSVFSVIITNDMKQSQRAFTAPAEVSTLNGPDLNGDWTLGFKIKAKKYVKLFKSKVLGVNEATKKDEQKLRATYRAYFEGRLEHNRRCGAGNEICGLSMLPVSANIFGYPPDEAGKIVMEETLRFLANNPEFDVRLLVTGSDRDKNAGRLKGAIDDAASLFGINTQVSHGRKA
jgi:O-acetyl-ADP-ribose deacetylase (regulator of RNase III)